MPAQHIHLSLSLYMTLLVCRCAFTLIFPCLVKVLNVVNFVSVGPDAVKYIANHANIEAIFCVPNTLNTVSLFLIF